MMNIKNIFIGVDGGGTKCKVRVEDEQGELLGQAKDGPANISISVDDSWNSIRNGINSALGQSGIDINNSNYRFYVGLGLAGTEDRKAKKEFLGRSHPFTGIYLQSDAYAACLGAHDGKDGAIIIIGTGVVGMCVQGKNIVQVGGWGFPHSDDGGGAWLGMQSIRLATEAYDGRIKFTPLLRAILDKFNGDICSLTSWAINARSTQFGELAPLIIHYVDKGDLLAIRLIKQAAHEIDRIAITMNRRANDDKFLPCSLFGGVAPFVEPWLSDEVRSRLVERKHDATKGAIFMAKPEARL